MYEVSRMIANKKKYIFNVLVILFTVIALITSIVGSFVTYQYEITKKNFIDNKFAKTIEISSFSNSNNEVRKLLDTDLEVIETINLEKEFNFEIITEYFINFGINTSDDSILFIKTFSNDILTGYQLDRNTIITRNENLDEKIILHVPIIEESSEGYTSTSTVSKEYDVYKLDDSSILKKYIKEDEIIISEDSFSDLFKMMFPNFKNYDIEKIYINLENIEDVKKVANILSREGYNLNHAFEYYENLDNNIVTILSLSVFVLFILAASAICLIIGLFELMLKNSVGDIAVLKHFGFTGLSIQKIYITPMCLRFVIAQIIILLSNVILLKFNIVLNWQYVYIFQFLSILICLLSLGVMIFRIRNYSEKTILNLLKICKIEE